MNNNNNIDSYTPDMDGKNHINIHLESKTDVGRKICHFFRSPFTHPILGPFVSMEGFWHYIQSIERPETMRELYGMRAKEAGKLLTWRKVNNFKDIILAANYYKIEQDEELKKEFLRSSLPFDMYYVFVPEVGEPMQIRRDQNKWLIECFEKIRTMMQHGERPVLNPDDYL